MARAEASVTMDHSPGQGDDRPRCRGARLTPRPEAPLAAGRGMESLVRMNEQEPARSLVVRQAGFHLPPFGEARPV